MAKGGKKVKKAGKKLNKKPELSTKEERLRELGILTKEEVADEEREEAQELELREDEEEVIRH